MRELAQQVCRIAKDAGAAILEIYEASEGIVFTKKDDDSPLTQADQASNDVICAGLEALSVKHPIISEENKAIDYEQRKDFDYAWLVDPLDGTKEFIKRNGEFTVNIALIHQQEIVLGVVYIPVSDEMYWAVKGEGAFEGMGDNAKRLEAPRFSMKDAGLGLVCSRSHINEETQAFVDQFATPELVSRGSSLKFLLLAKGEAHVYPRV